MPCQDGGLVVRVAALIQGFLDRRLQSILDVAGYQGFPLAPKPVVQIKITCGLREKDVDTAFG